MLPFVPANRTPDAGFDLEQAYADHARVLYGFVVNAVDDRAEAEDLVQEVFARAWRSSSRYDPDRGSVRTWLFAIARNLVLDAHRARTRRPRVVGEVTDDVEPPTAGPEDAVVDRVRIVEALARLSPEHRQVVTAVHLDGLTYAQVSKATGVPGPTLRTRVFHGLRAMRSILAEIDEEGGNDG